MKAFVFVPAAAAAILALNIASASSQAACQQEYQACMTACAAKSVRAVQGGCFEGCESKNNMCAERVYGKRPSNFTPPSAAAEPRGQAKDALARREKGQQAGPQEQVADERAPQRGPQQEQAPQQEQQPPRGPARR